MKSRVLVALISIIVGITIIGGGVFAYFNYFQPPEKIIQKMMTKVAEVKSWEYSGEIKSKVRIGDSSAFLQPPQQVLNKKESNFLINFTGLSDIQNPNNPKSKFSFNIKTDALPQGEFTFGLEVRMLDKFIYIKLTDVPNLDLFDLGAIKLDVFDLSAIKNQWIKIDPEALKKQFGLEKLEEQIKEMQLTPEQIEKIKTVIQQAKIFKITEKLPSEKIEGVSTYHYKFTIDKEGAKKLFTDIGQIVEDKPLTEEELAEFDKSLETTEWPEGEIWIGKKDLLPYKIVLSSIVKETTESKISGKISFTLLLKNFNKPVQIDIPQQAKPLEEFLKGLFEGLLKGAVPPFGQQDFGKDTDKDGLPDQLETMYGTNPNKADTDGDGFKDGEEIEKGYNPKGPGKLLPNMIF